MSGINNNVNINQLNQLKQLADSGKEIKKSDLGGEQQLFSIFDQVNDPSNDENGVEVLKDQAKELNPFSKLISGLINTLNGNNNVQNSLTPADVEAVTQQPSSGVDNANFVDNKGNIESDIKNDGTIKTGDTTIRTTKNSVSASEAGKDIGGATKLPNGMLVLDNGEGQKAVYDPNKGEFMNEADSKKMLEQFGVDT